MIIQDLITYLNTSSLGVSAYAETPENPPASYVLLEHIAGGEENQILNTRISVKSIAGTLYGAASLNENVKKLVMGAVSLPKIGSVTLNSDYNNTNTATKQYRYQAVFDIVHYKED